MEDPHALVDVIGTITPASSRLIAEAADPGDRGAGPALTKIEFDGGRVGLLDVSTQRGQAWSRVLESLHRAKAPVYVEIDPVSAVITQLLVPYVVTVGDITPSASDDGVDVELVISHAVHTLRKSRPDYEQLLGILKEAQERGSHVTVTETQVGHEIIDVRPLRDGNDLRGSAIEGGTQQPSVKGPSSAGAPAQPGVVDDEPVVLSTVSLAQAQRLFDLANSRVCCPAVAAAPCVPFLYPDDGCWGRAHEMYRLMLAEGALCDKVWIFGSLRVASANNPRCEVRWGWHVAPTLLVDTGSGSPQLYVVDPSLFPSPVPQATWAGVQGDPNPTLIASPGSEEWVGCPNRPELLADEQCTGDLPQPTAHPCHGLRRTAAVLGLSAGQARRPVLRHGGTRRHAFMVHLWLAG
jgi:hypothetical protein